MVEEKSFERRRSSSKFQRLCQLCKQIPPCGGTWQSDPGNSSHPPDTVPADMTVIVSSLITKSGPIESGDIPMMVTVHTDPGYSAEPRSRGHRNGNSSYLWKRSSSPPACSTCSTSTLTLNRPDSPKRPRRVPLVAGVFFRTSPEFSISVLLIQSVNLAVRRV